MAVSLSEFARSLIDGKNFATLATLNPDGGPQTSVIWVKRDGDDVLFSATERRRKVRNLVRDPRVSLSIFDTANPYAYAEIRGTASVTEDPGKALPKELSHKYVGEDPPFESGEIRRVIVRVTPEKIVEFTP
ncbi:PPOX class F420-dependent oxidoreductase [Amycolatopsis anabasis]|uniref:PPOX class F420-dependent oxidoreductase n=1 Tax=Amycolatopsis anabasis TaxID=1840409 RepID=UPI00131C4EDD|nr:PPOX class F420-dependent oxidoreductase [Amycolatopsis anabasis]